MLDMMNFFVCVVSEWLTASLWQINYRKYSITTSYFETLVDFVLYTQYTKMFVCRQPNNKFYTALANIRKRLR